MKKSIKNLLIATTILFISIGATIALGCALAFDLEDKKETTTFTTVVSNDNGRITTDMGMNVFYKEGAVQSVINSIDYTTLPCINGTYYCVIAVGNLSSPYVIDKDGNISSASQEQMEYFLQHYNK